MIAGKTLLRSAVLTLLTLVGLPAWAAAQRGPEIMARAMAAQAERLEGVENVTLTQNTMGMNVTVYMEKKAVGGVPSLVPVTMVVEGEVTPLPQDMTSSDWSNPFQQAWAERARLEGEEELAGTATKILVIDDFSGLELPSLPVGEGSGQDLEPKSMRFWMDEDDYLMRKMEMEAEARRDDGTVSPIRVSMLLEDFREVGGYLHPFSTRVTTRGMMEAVDADPAELQGQLAELKQRLAELPEAQRAMMEGMLQQQIEMMEGMTGGGEGMEMTVTVTDLKVNAGPPGGD